MIRQAVDILKSFYELDELLHIEEIRIGCVNRSFAASVKIGGKQQKFLVRCYNHERTAKEIRFEHALINHLRSNRFALAAKVIPQKNGNTFIELDESVSESRCGAFWAVFEFLEGEDRYTWTDTCMSLEEMQSAAGVLADMHHAGWNFVKPADADRTQPGIMDLLNTFQMKYNAYSQRGGTTEFERLFLSGKNDILKTVEKIKLFDRHSDQLPRVAIHCDYHQGNLKYKDNMVSGVFDYDWSKIDYRLFDLGLALVYFCSRWGEKTGDCLDLEKCQGFLGIYEKRCRRTESPGPLTDVEKIFLPKMVAAGNLFVLHWTIVDYYSTYQPSSQPHLSYFLHNYYLMRWIESNESHIAAISQ
jgi:homoserine kinase type II